MATTCKNNTINYLRKSSTKIQANSVSYEHGEYEYDTTPVSPEDRFIQNETVAFVLDKAIPNLNEQLQDPILLRMQGYKYSEISEILGLKLGTVKSRIFFARRDLIPYFNSHGFSPD
jgi:RNA polymerase sigma-70 factor (ECF subfamily)